MSPASFHRHFKTITQVTPVQFQKQVGYESPSQFSRDYRKLFGAPLVKKATANVAKGDPEYYEARTRQYIERGTIPPPKGFSLR
jgi:AraC-like DNA-binding protein